MEVISLIEHMGTAVFAMSGILTASEKQLDLFGGFIIAFVTALGGGTLRDLILNVEVSWVLNTNYIYTVFIAAILAIIFKKHLKQLRKTTFLFDTLGIAMFTILALQKSIGLDTPISVAIILGVISATFGGVIRDILCNEIPLIFRKEIYATACLVGAAFYVIFHLFELNSTLNLVLSGSIIITIRIISVVKKLSLPLINDKF